MRWNTENIIPGGLGPLFWALWFMAFPVKFALARGELPGDDWLKPSYAEMSLRQAGPGSLLRFQAGGSFRPQNVLSSDGPQKLFGGFGFEKEAGDFSMKESAAFFSGVSLLPWSFGAGLGVQRGDFGGWNFDPFLLLLYARHERAFENGGYAFFSSEGVLRGGLAWRGRAGRLPFWLGLHLSFRCSMPFFTIPGARPGCDQTFLAFSTGMAGVFSVGLGYDLLGDLFSVEGDFALEKFSPQLSLRIFLDISSGFQKPGVSVTEAGVALRYSFDAPLPFSLPPQTAPEPSWNRGGQKSKRWWPTFQQFLSWGISPVESLHLARFGNCEGVSAKTKKILKQKRVRCPAFGDAKSRDKEKNHEERAVKTPGGGEKE